MNTRADSSMLNRFRGRSLSVAGAGVLVALTIWWWSPYQQVRRTLIGMNPAWGVTGIRERYPGARELIRERGRRVVPILLKMVNDRDADVRGAAISALAIFPEAADESLPVVLQRFSQCEDDALIELLTLGATLNTLLSANPEVPLILTNAVSGDSALKRMIAVDVILHRSPSNSAARRGLLRSLETVREDRSVMLTDIDLRAAFHAVQTLTELAEVDRDFAVGELDRIASFSNEYTTSFSEIGRMCDFIRNLLPADATRPAN